MDQDDIFASPKRKHDAVGNESSNRSSRKKKAKKADDPPQTPRIEIGVVEADGPGGGGDFRSFASSLPLASFSATETCNGNKKKKKKKQQAASQSGGASDSPASGGGFRSLAANLPVATFSATGTSDGKVKVEEGSSPSPAKDDQVTESPGARDKKPLPLPNSTESGKRWTQAVVASRENERFAGAFNFGSWKQKCEESGIDADWIMPKAFGPWCESNPQIIAIDCEMCETQDPVSRSKNSKALCRLSVINGERPEEVLLDTLVKPSWPVTDYRSRINGISKEHLDGVQFTLRHAQSFMMSLCSEETVVVGHAVHNDLAALNMEHHCVADSSLLFRAKDSPTSSVSLKDLVSGIFKEKMPETHDSVNDARKALESVLHWMEKGGKVAEIERTTSNGRSAQLFVHRIPKACKADHFTTLFQKYTTIVPTEVDEVDFNGDTGRTHVTFKSSGHANLAFQTLEGSAEPDKSGRLQKKVYLKTGGYVRIRKMVHERSSI